MTGVVVVLHPFEQRVETRFHAVARHHRVAAHARERGDPSRLRRLRESLEQGERLVALASDDEQLGEGRHRARMIGLQVERGA